VEKNGENCPSATLPGLPRAVLDAETATVLQSELGNNLLKD
jgi:hypothetical protein